MVDKKTSVIAVLCVTTVLFLGLWINAGREAYRLGSLPINKVVVFVFPYRNGNFAGRFWGYQENTVEDLYMGETCNYDFIGLPDDMTSYKVLTVVG